MRAEGKNGPDGEVGRDGMSQFSKACHRITSEPNTDTLMKAVVNEARSIVGARHGAIQAMEGPGLSHNCITVGLAPTVAEQNGHPGIRRDVPGGRNGRQKTPAIQYGSGKPDPVDRLQNLQPENPHPATPVRHLGKRVGDPHLAGEGGGQVFTPEDEFALGMFASYAAVVVADARLLDRRKRAIADPEALISISPVAVLVLDSKTGVLLSNNEETRRIVDKVNAPATYSAPASCADFPSYR